MHTSTIIPKVNVPTESLLRGTGTTYLRTVLQTCTSAVRPGYLESITWLDVPDEETMVAGLETGEWHVLDGIGFEYFQRFMDNPDISVSRYLPGHRFLYHLNPSHPPFEDLNARRAALLAADIDEIMSSLGASDVWNSCPSIYYCSTPLETDAGARGWYAEFDPGRASRLLDESPYAGETIVMLAPRDAATLVPSSTAFKRQLEAIGFRIDMPRTDWATVVTQMGDSEKFELAAGWPSHWCCGDPIADESGAGSSHLWPKIPYVTELRRDWARETDPDKRAAILDRVPDRVLRERVRRLPRCLLPNISAQ